MKICLLCEGVASTDAAVCASCGGRLLGTDEIHFPVRRGEEDAAHPLLGTLVDGKYRVAGVLGRGGMGAVFRATHEVSLMPIALKLLHPRLASRLEYRAQFLAEARKAGRVVHEHTARILDVGETQDGSIYIAQELVPGSTLHEWLHGGAPLRPEVVVEILRQVCAALAAAHGVGLVHRDLTPRNIMVDVQNGRPAVKVLDFGIARGGLERAPGVGDDGLAMFASPPYAAPEHLAGLEVDARADLYGLGVIAYEALTGRVPTPGSSPREHAAATVRGELLPLSQTTRLPRRLVRLIERLLARDPNDRPATAAAVLAELEAIAAPRGGRLRVVALGSLLLAVVALGLAFSNAPPAPFLTSTPSQALELLPSMPRDVKVTPMRSADLALLRFDHAGVDAARLSVEVWQSAELVTTQPLRPEVRGGTLTLDARQPDYAELLEVVKSNSKQGPVHLKFVVPGSPPLAYSVLRIDDDPPLVSLSVQDCAADGAINEKSSFRLEMTDQQAHELLLEVRCQGRTRELQLPLLGQRVVSAPDLLAGLFPPPAPVRDVVLTLVGRDAAGNVARSADVSCPTLDLGTPRISRVVGARAEVRRLLLGSNGVRLRVELLGSEPGLQVEFGRAGTTPQACVDVVEAGPGLDVTWRPSPADPPPDDLYTLVLRDAAANEATFTDAYTFATERLDPVLVAVRDAEAEPRGGRAVVAKDGVLWDGNPTALGFRCNVAYRPQEVQVLTAEGGEQQPHAARLESAADGRGTVLLDALADGRYRFEVRTRAPLGGDEQTAAYPLLVRRQPVTLRLPRLAGGRFLASIAERGVLTWREGVLGDGRGWSLDPPDSRWLRGTIWFGGPRPAALALPERVHESDPLLPPLRPWRGENVLGVCLRDALDRPVQVLRGDEAAPALEPAPDADAPRGQAGSEPQRVVELVRFLWHDEPPRARTSEVHVEYGQPGRFVIDAPLPYSPADPIHLHVDTMPCAPKQVVPAQSGGAELEFEIPFDRLVALARLGGLGPEQFAENRLSEPFTLWLAVPDGRHAFEVRVRTSRSTLEPQRLGELAAPAVRPPASSSEVLMVPILGPGLGRTWQDPVPATCADRVTFRPGSVLDVRNVEDFYLQQHETTRAQYADVVAAIADAWERGEPLPREEIVHHADPQAASRLRVANLVPKVFLGDVAAFTAAVRAGPDRPVAGLDFFQAYTFTRAVGWLVAREPALLRLPTGVELELAALGAKHSAASGDLLLNGAMRSGGVRVAAAQAAAMARPDPARWPFTAAELASAGDRVVSELGVEITGLDFGIREWVADLPLPPGEGGHAFDAVADHVRHLEAAEELARGELRLVERPLLRFGMARGMALDELVSTPQGTAVHAHGRWPARVPGVVRVLQLARDGSGMLPNELDPHLPVLGVRLCGGRVFLSRVRAR